DFDDAIFLASSSLPNSFIERFKNPDKIGRVIKMSEYVIAGNGYLANFALKFNRKVTVIPTCIDTDKYYPQAKNGLDKIVIGWIGSITTLKFVDLIEEVFRELSIKFSNLWLKTVGGSIQIKGVPNVICKPWSEKDEIEDLKSFDIGIMPMPDNEWTRGKCGFKAILYMSMGIPCVCSAVGVNKEIITDGINGFLANTEDDWLEKLSLLIKDYDLRKNIGLAGRKTIEEKYSLRVNAPRFLEVMQRVYDRRK
ncbi:MAG: glycosyltransferase family 4 protein, partial [Candidatus Omnitrophica bacterium]|nr:glycosyltransferase family 4 protein [Candidatus Omnitrophota bacterium]